jgi:hypothetical protein
MSLAAAQVIDALVARITPLAATAGRVVSSRAWPWSEDELPACRVIAQDEPVEQAASDVPFNVHRLDVEVQYTTRVTADLDDQLHSLAVGALPLLFAPPIPYALQLTGISRQVSTEGEAAVGRISLMCNATFYVNPTAPETLI